MRILPINRKRLIHLHVLAGFHASPAKNALLRVVAVKRVRVILFVGLCVIWNGLVFDSQQFFGVVNGAVSVVVVAYRAIKDVIAQNAIERISLLGNGLF